MQEVVEIPIEQLRRNEHNSNVMPEALLRKLTANIGRSGRYPPIIVRPSEPEVYEILDGHHRVEALRRLEHRCARCVVWEVDEAEALELLATLNRLQGEDDPARRGALLAKLAAHHDSLDALAKRLPEPREQMERLMRLNEPAPAPRPPRGREAMPEAVQFFLLPSDRHKLERCLRGIGGQRDQALMQMVDYYCDNHSQID